MTVKKIHVHSGDFTTIPNETVRDQRLQLDTLGLLVRLLSRPGDWHFHKSQLRAELGIGRERLDRMFDELHAAGYVHRVENRLDGKFNETDWHVVPVSGEPWTGKPSTVEPSTVEPSTGRPTTTKKDFTKKDRTKKDLTNPSALFERVWECYPRKIDRKGAEAKFNARLKEGVAFEELFAATVNYARACSGKETSYIMHGATFFGPSRRWEDYRDGSVELSKTKKQVSIKEILTQQPRGGN